MRCGVQRCVQVGGEHGVVNQGPFLYIVRVYAPMPRHFVMTIRMRDLYNYGSLLQAVGCLLFFSGLGLVESRQGLMNTSWRGHQPLCPRIAICGAVMPC